MRRLATPTVPGCLGDAVSREVEIAPPPIRVSSMPQIGHSPGASAVTSGCIGQAYFRDPAGARRSGLVRTTAAPTAPTATARRIARAARTSRGKRKVELDEPFPRAAIPAQST